MDPAGQGNQINPDPTITPGKMPEQRTGGPMATPGVGASQAGGKKRRWRRGLLTWLLVGATVVAAGVMTFTFFAYRSYTEPDRSTPVLVVEQYVNATFDGDEPRARRFECGRPELTDLEAMAADISRSESQFEIDITVRAGEYKETINGDTATVTTRLEVSSAVSSSFRTWEFTLRDQSGWRVCGAKRIA